ncbi:MAG: response regulator transcription factor [Bacteroidia bacterium]|nr:response regulator transcription factor [Bacteroidia bacterium]
MKKIKLLLADDHPIVLSGLRSTFEKEDSIEIIGECQNMSQIMDTLKTKEVDIVILDLQLPNESGFKVAKKIKEEYRDVRILIFSFHAKEKYIHFLLEIGVNGYITKGEPTELLIEAVYHLSQGREFFGKDFADKVEEIRSRNDKRKIISFSKREELILLMMAQGLKREEIANNLKIKSSTVDTYKRRLIMKTNVSNTAELVAFAFKQGYVP